MGSEDSRVAAQMYSEKSYVMAKGFVKQALSSPPQGLADVLDRLYISQSGPRLLDRIIDDCQQLSGRPSVRSDTEHEDNDAHGREVTWAGSTKRLSAGALVLLRRHLEWLVECNDKNQAKTSEPS